MAVIKIPANAELDFLSRWRDYAKQNPDQQSLLDPIKAGPVSRNRIKFIEVDLAFLRVLHRDGFPFE